MATETSDYAAVNRFIQSVKLRECFTPPPAAPSWMGDHIPYLGLRVLTGPCVPFESVATGVVLYELVRRRMGKRTS